MTARSAESVFFQGSTGAADPTPNGVKFDGTETAVVANFTTAPISTKLLDAFSIQISTVAGSTLAGTFTFQASDDRGNSQAQDGIGHPSLVNWVPISMTDMATLTTVANKAIVSGANQAMLAALQCTYRWIRLVFAFTSGSGSPILQLQQKNYA